MNYSLQNQGSGFGGQGGRDFHSFPGRGVVLGLSGCLFVFLIFKEVFTSHTSDLRTETEILTCFLMPKHQQKWELSLYPWQWELADKCRGTVPHSQVKLLDGQHQLQRAENLFFITFWDVWQRLSQMPESCSCCPKSFGNRILMPQQGSSAALLGSLRTALEVWVDVSGCHEHHWLGLWDPAWCLTPSTVGPALERCYFRQSWNYFVSRAVPSPKLMSALLTFWWPFLLSHYGFLTIIRLLTNKGFFSVNERTTVSYVHVVGITCISLKAQKQSWNPPFFQSRFKSTKVKQNNSDITTSSMRWTWPQTLVFECNSFYSLPVNMANHTESCLVLGRPG